MSTPQPGRRQALQQRIAGAHVPASQQSWLALSGRVRYGLEDREPSGPTLTNGGPINGVRSPVPDREVAQIASDPSDYYVDVHKDDKAS